MTKYLILILSISWIFFIRCRNNERTITPTISNVVESVYASGIVKSEKQYEVFTKVNGVVGIIFAKEGALVKKGAPLFQIENVNLKLSEENARFYSLANDYKRNQEKVSEAKDFMELAQIRLVKDSLLYMRQQDLWQQNIGSKIDLEQKELSFESAKVNLKKSKVAYDDMIRQLKLASDQSKNSLKMAEAAGRDLIIRSEVDGYVYKINVQQGELATSMSSLAIVGKENFVIELLVDELDIVKIVKGQKVIVKMDSYQNQTFEALVNFVYPMMNERNRTFKVEAVFNNKPEVLYPNLSLEANIIINEKKNVLTVPTEYLLNDSSVVLEDGTVKELKIGLKDYSIAEIVSGADTNTKIRMPKNEK
ncbi:MAG: HlyD family efflux transporter periplasmic adaptor subunit [Saprospiraceae bacterium]|nr:HlyD family efflux transporter periplasmic adaptor subunit [Saprospiraceae bacterium]